MLQDEIVPSPGRTVQHEDLDTIFGPRLCEPCSALMQEHQFSTVSGFSLHLAGLGDESSDGEPQTASQSGWRRRRPRGAKLGPTGAPTAMDRRKFTAEVFSADLLGSRRANTASSTQHISYATARAPWTANWLFLRMVWKPHRRDGFNVFSSRDSVRCPRIPVFVLCRRPRSPAATYSRQNLHITKFRSIQREPCLSGGPIFSAPRVSQCGILRRQLFSSQRHGLDAH